MKTIKIFLASSEELKEERKELADLVCHLNNILHKQNINVMLEKWEYMNSSMEAQHKQEEYNDRLKECELCMVLYWTKFGIYTKSELDTAYKEHNSGNNPKKLYVYFKNTGEDITEELRAFKDSFPVVYGHFCSEFNNLDSLKSYFLLQFMDYQNNMMKGSKFIEVRDSQVFISDKPVVDLKNVAFTGNNDEYNRLLKDIRKTRKLLSVTDVEDPDYSVYAQELIDLEKRQKEMEESLWETALAITRLSNAANSERLQRAIELFNKGDNRGADAILNEEEIYKDVNHNLRLIELGEEGRKGLLTNIDELSLKINTLWNERTEGWGEKVCEIHKKIVELTEKLYGEDSSEVADALGNVAVDKCDYIAALDNYKRALKIRLEKLGDNHPDVATNYYNIGWICSLLCDFSSALENFEKALQILLEIFGENHPDVAMIYNGIGLIYSDLMYYEVALENYEKALKIRLEIFGANHPDVAMSYNNVGLVYYNQGNYAATLENYEKALKIQMETFDENHPDVAMSYNNIGMVYYNQGNYSAALENHEKALKIRLEIFGANHPDIAMSYNNVGLVYYNQCNYSAALENYEKALKIWLETFGAHHPDVALSYNNIGMVYDNQGDYSAALENLEEALTIWLEIFGENHPRVALSYNNIGMVYYNQGNYSAALDIFEKALQIWLETFGENHPNVDMVRDNISAIKKEMSE